MKKDQEHKTTQDDKAKSHNLSANISQFQTLTQVSKKDKYYGSR